MKRFLKQFIPPVLFTLKAKLSKQYRWNGHYDTWTKAKQLTKGYDEAHILEKVKSAALKVKNGEAAFERDSVCFDKKEYDFNVLASLLYVASLNQNKLTVLDFGGSLGSLYYLYKDFLAHIDLKWCVVEQEHYVNCGGENFQDSILEFYDKTEGVIKKYQIDIILFSSVLQYLESPYVVLEDLLKITKTKFLFIDKTPLIGIKEDYIAIQKVPPSIYSASYPCWIFSEDVFVEKLERLGFKLIFNQTIEMQIPIDSKYYPYKTLFATKN